MEKIDHARRGHVIYINEHFYIYWYKCNKNLSDKQKIDENYHKNILFDIAIIYTDKPSENWRTKGALRLTRLQDMSSLQHVPHTTTTLIRKTHYYTGIGSSNRS
jgi:intein-encoded DNA endonuclease-like protein